MARQITGKKPKNMKKTIRTFLRYLGNHTFALLFVGVLVIVSAGANLYGTYLLNPIIDNYILPHDYDGLAAAILFMALMYAGGVVCTAIYKQLMMERACILSSTM